VDSIEEYAVNHITLPTATRNRYTFNGWKAESAAPIKGIRVISADTKFNSDFELSAPFTEIKSMDDLEIIRTELSASYKLMIDIDLGGINWTPIGTFTGVFEGNGKTIEGLSINASGNTGLFSYISGGARIADLTVELTGSGITGTGSSSGGIAGYAVGVSDSSPTRIVNAHVKVQSGQAAKIRGLSYAAGGIVGQAGNYVTIANCSNGAPVESRYVGGILGNPSYGVLSIKIYNSWNTGAVAATYDTGGSTSAGGIVGNNSVFITNSYNTGTVIASSNGTTHAGGIIGDGALYSSISNSYNTGAVSATTNTNTVTAFVYGAHAGGIAGYFSNVVFNTYNTGDVSAASITPLGTGDREIYAAGIVGYLRALSGTVEVRNNVAANSGVIGNTDNVTMKLNRVVGYSNAGVSAITGNIALGSMAGSGGFENESAYLGEDKTEGELKTQATYEAIGWKFGDDADNPWKPMDGSDYPHLYWE
jgi:hypothetical protein